MFLLSNSLSHRYTDTQTDRQTDRQTWSELLAPLVNMIKEGCENESALLIRLIFYLKIPQKSNLSLENKNEKCKEISLQIKFFFSLIKPIIHQKKRTAAL